MIVVGDLDEARAATEPPAKERARPEPPPSQRPSPSQSPRQRARSFLVDYLAGGAKPSTDVLEAAKEAGIATITLRRAKLAIVVEPVKSGSNAIDLWIWRLSR